MTFELLYVLRMKENSITPYVTYIMANSTNAVLYVGVTNDLKRRVVEHKSEINVKGFTAKYHVDKLVYFEEFQSITDAIAREKQLKHWNRQWKNALICKMNPEWNDLFVGE
ncbi:GIY-YIG nuclease family protein [Fibrobacter sp. UWEL]|uniref:GIY-YIG nuclease family protein n=1 Tax=Fibrobacter sp. UWEL TaxID=1896209 RepID=UPI001F194B7F|nr:GIY-YIG nuclease family protein [Fibrobacter sp. UWEL]